MVTTGSAQPDIVLPGHAEVDTWVPDSGLPMTDLWLELHGDFRDIPMPPGPKGPDGPPGRPRATFVKMGAIANEAARPAVLGPGARGWWWHRIDTNGMDVWCGDHWQHSPNAVGPVGPAAVPNTLTPLPVLRDERYTMAAVRVRGRKPDNQTIEYTVPAGERGARGPDGNVFGTAITDAPDYDDVGGPVNGSLFAYSRKTKRFRAMSRPGQGYGPYHFGESNFSGYPTMGTGDQGNSGGSQTIATLTMPALPYAWRPFVWGNLQTGYALQGSIIFGDKTGSLKTAVRLNSDDGEQVGTYVNMYPTVNSSVWVGTDGSIRPFFGVTQSTRFERTTYGVVNAYEECVLVVRLEIQARGAIINWGTSGAYLDVWAVPVKGDVNAGDVVVDYSQTDGGYSEWQL